MNWDEFFSYKFSFGSYSISVTDIVAVLVVILVARLLIWFINGVVLERLFIRREVDAGRRYSIRQFFSYLIYVFATFLIMEITGVSGIIWASSAAILVGIGLGLQDIFKDLLSGIVLLVDGSVEVEDIISIDNKIAKVKKIGLRTSTLETLNSVSILIPNSKLVSEKVINWSHNKTFNRFQIKIGVAYGSDLEKVKELLLQAASDHPDILKAPSPSIQFSNFGGSSLDFTLVFFSLEFFKIDIIKSDLRFKIDHLFRQQQIEIPFPQRQLRIVNEGKAPT